MYVCLCNALSDDAVNGAIDAGAATEDRVYAHHGCEAVCGRCKPTIRSMIDAHAHADGLEAEGRTHEPQPYAFSAYASSAPASAE
jgi:bacterioferritin-associated ferredoxin